MLTRRIRVMPTAIEDLQYWVRANEKKYQRILTILEQLRVNPKVAIGKPKELKYELAGLWACRVDNSRSEWNRLVYSFDEENLYIWQARYHYIKVPSQQEREQMIKDLDNHQDSTE